MPTLTPKENTILKLVCDEKTNYQIAAKLKVSVRHTERLKANLYHKVEVKSSVGLVKWAIVNNMYALKKKPARLRK